MTAWWAATSSSRRPAGLGLFDLVIMNPPFDGQRDIDPVTHAVRFLKPGGTLLAMRLAPEFRRLMERMRGRFIDLPAGSFAEAGTMVNTVIAVLHAARA